LSKLWSNILWYLLFKKTSTSSFWNWRRRKSLWWMFWSIKSWVRIIKFTSFNNFYWSKFKFDIKEDLVQEHLQVQLPCQILIPLLHHINLLQVINLLHTQLLY